MKNFLFKIAVSAAALGFCFVSAAPSAVLAAGGESIASNEETEKQTVITVGKGSGYEFKTVQDAVSSINFTPTEDNKAVILIAPGEYEEVVYINTPYVTLKGETGMAEDVVITYDRSASHENPEKKFGTQQSATVTADTNAVGFSTENVTVQNSYNLNQPNLGDDGGRGQTQAVALVTMCDKVVLKNSRFLGRQDTLYLKGASKGGDVYGDANYARVYAEKCFIEGTVDYIFGDACAYFYDCDLNMAYYTNGGHYTAANTTLYNIGYVFDSCRLTADEKYYSFEGNEKKNVDLGRPWQGDNTYPNYGSHTVFINCVMDDEILSLDGFSAWNESTVTNKIRYYEYGSVNQNGEPIDLSQRIGWEKILTEKQAKAYADPCSILKGEDNWNPTGTKTHAPQVLDVTLDKYSIEIPKGETAELKAFVLPVTAKNKNAAFSTSDAAVAEVDAKTGLITAVSEGEAVISATTDENKFSVSCNVSVLPERTAPPSVSKISLSADNYEPNNKIYARYSYAKDSDNAADKAKIKWYSVEKNGVETLVKEGRGQSALSYDIKGADIGCRIKLCVIPETATSYGDTGKIAEKLSYEIKAPKGYKGETYLRDGFDDFDSASAEKGTETSDTRWVRSSAQPLMDGAESFVTVAMDGNPSVGGGTTDSTMIEYQPKDGEEAWKDVSLETRMIFNPTSGGFSSTCYYNIFTNYDKETGSYYKLSVLRGANTNSLELYLYKNEGNGAEDELLASDTESLKNAVPQNSGEDNPWFLINQTNKNGKIKVTFRLEAEDEPLSILEAEDAKPLSNGFIAFENYGKVSVLLNDYVICEKSE